MSVLQMASLSIYDALYPIVKEQTSKLSCHYEATSQHLSIITR